ncbi:MAG: GNAT family protein [Thermoanaerobaculia bacterium]
MQPHETARPARVTLRAAQRGDAALLKRWRAEPSVRQFQPLGKFSMSHLASELAAQRMEDLYRGRGDKFQWIIRCDGEPAGWITLVVTNWDHGLAETGYALSSPYQSRGLMPQALDLLLADLFLNAPLVRIEARCAVDNVASQKVLEKVGFQREGRLRGYFVLGGRRVDNYLYAILREDYLPGNG